MEVLKQKGVRQRQESEGLLPHRLIVTSTLLSKHAQREPAQTIVLAFLALLVCLFVCLRA